jgi:hypothetical protein
MGIAGKYLFGKRLRTSPPRHPELEHARHAPLIR